VKGAIAYYGAVGLFLFAAMALHTLGINTNNILVNNISTIHTFNLPAGMPTPATITNMGSSLAPIIMQSSQFKALAKGIPYHINQYSSFGYTWGPNFSSTERIIFFSLDNNSYIVTDIYTSNDIVQDIYFVNATKLNIYASSANSDNWGGYQAQYCSGTFLGICTWISSVGKTYGNIQIPSSMSAPSGASSSCCAVAEWTGVASNENGTKNLTQGGIIAKFDNLKYWNWSTPWAFFTEYFPTQNTIHVIKPPSWFTGLGQTVNMTIEPLANCPNGTNDWYEVWSSGGSSTSQGIGCRSTSSMIWSEYELESPGSCSGTGGNYNGYCQLPQFSSVEFTGNICPATSGTCRNINSNSNPIFSQYIEHNNQDTSTSSISSGGNSWTEGWLSSS
jgi:hypothetical protein